MLSQAASVVLASVTGELDRQFDLPAVEGAEYLSRHGIVCEMIEFPLQGRPVAEVLAEAAGIRKASYLVMGAYGRPRLAEMVLGGVTKDFFARPPLPILMCH
jgi:nucleotide-binding universal stress UspA family protein